MPKDLKKIQFRKNKKKDLQHELLREFSTLNRENLTDELIDLSQDSDAICENVPTESI